MPFWIGTQPNPRFRRHGDGKANGKGKGKGKGREKGEWVCVFFLFCCVRGVCSGTWLLEGERARIYVPICNKSPLQTDTAKQSKIRQSKKI